MIIAGTGHRKIGGYQLPNPIYNKVCQETEKILLELKPDKVISGMAIGYDQWLANIAIKLNIPLTCALPHINQEKIWPEKSQKIYHNILAKASEKIIISDGEYAAWKMQKRNEYLCDNCDILIAVFDQNTQNGGTYNCLQYAKKINKEIIYIDPVL